jgi:hypothetical protein
VLAEASALILPFTCKGVEGLVVPIPTLLPVKAIYLVGFL